MTEKQYYIGLLFLSSIFSFIQIVFMPELGNSMPDPIVPPQILVVAFEMLVQLFFSAIFLAIGMHFAKKIGAKFLLIDNGYSLKNDILKPAIIVGVATAFLALIVNKMFPFDVINPSFFKDQPLSYVYEVIMPLGVVFSGDTTFLLLLVSGFACLIRYMAKSVSMNLIVYVSVALTAFLFNLGFPLLLLGMTEFAIGMGIRCGIDCVLGILFWKKGFETAVLYHLIVVFVFYTAKAIGMGLF